MQGYILKTTYARAEDLILRILTPSRVLTLYRFYGARHSPLHIGKKIDFEVESAGIFLPKLRNALHLGHAWEADFERSYIWQRFTTLLSAHLSDVDELDGFYYDMLENGAASMRAQNPMRVAVEMYLGLLAFEGRSANDGTCFVCGEALGARVSLARAFLFAHSECIGAQEIERAEILAAMEQKSTIHLDDESVKHLWEVLNLGL